MLEKNNKQTSFKTRSYKDFLNLPKNLMIKLPTSYDVIGDILIVKLVPELQDYKIDIGDALLKSKKNYICLDKSAFYPVGGGQPSDIGFIKWDENISEICEVIKKGDTLKHIINGKHPLKGTIVHAELNWKRRYNHMKMHTAQHIISGIVFDDFHARTVGNQIHADHSRVDFNPILFTEEDLKKIEIHVSYNNDEFRYRFRTYRFIR